MPKIKTLTLLFGDIAIAYLALFAALYIRYGAVFSQSHFNEHFLHFSIIYVIWLFVFFVYDLFNIKKTIKFADFLRAYILVTFTSVVLAIIYFYVQSPFNIISPKTFLFIDAGIFFVLSALWHRFFLLGPLRKGFKKNIVIIGSSKVGKSIVQEVKKHKGLGYEVFAVVDIDGESKIKAGEDVKVLDIASFKEMVFSGLDIEFVVIANDIANEESVLDELFGFLSLRKIEFISAFSFYEKITGKVFLGTVGKIWFLENIHYPKLYGIAKRLTDLIFAVVVFPIFIIILPLLGFLIKVTSRGPIFFKQERVGLGGKIFTLYKLRTMVRDAESDGPQFAKRRDERVTGVGRIFRKLRLDELPQIINLLNGSMSLVGPRPERQKWIEKFEREIPFHKERNLVKPGLTGWAQVNWKYASTVNTMRTRLQYDLYYIKKQSLILDLEIILKTIRIVLSGYGR